MPQDHRPRRETVDLILEHLADASPMTRTQIARAIKRKKTPHLIDLLDDMVEEGLLSRAVKRFHNGVEGYVYSVIES